MTREEAIADIRDNIKPVVGGKSLDMAIKALEQEPCDKYIKEIDHLHKYISKLETQIVEQKPCDDTVSREDAKSFLYERLNRLNNDELYDIFSVIIDDMYNELPSVQLKSGWIPVSERLPKPNQYDGSVAMYYLVQNEYGDILVASYDSNGWRQIYHHDYLKDEVVAWMFLPKLYSLDDD